VTVLNKLEVGLRRVDRFEDAEAGVAESVVVFQVIQLLAAVVSGLASVTAVATLKLPDIPEFITVWVLALD